MCSNKETHLLGPFLDPKQVIDITELIPNAKSAVMAYYHFECPECEFDDVEYGQPLQVMFYNFDNSGPILSLKWSRGMICGMCAADSGREVQLKLSLIRSEPVALLGDKNG